MNDLERIEACVNELAWKTKFYFHPNKREITVEFSLLSPAGHDFNMDISMVDGNIRGFVENVKCYWDYYDPDEEAYLWLDNSGHGKCGAPHRMKDVAEDFEWIDNEIGKLYEQLLVKL